MTLFCISVAIGFVAHQIYEEWSWKRRERRRALQWRADLEAYLRRQNALAEQERKPWA